MFQLYTLHMQSKRNTSVAKNLIQALNIWYSKWNKNN